MKEGVRVSNDFGIVVKKAAIRTKQVSRSRLLEIMETESPYDEDEFLLSFGPHFGEEARNEFIRRLEEEGLAYYEDFFDFSETVPHWCSIYAHAKK